MVRKRLAVAVMVPKPLALAVRIRGRKYRVVGQIVGFEAQFEAAVLAEGEALDDVGVQLVDAIGAQVVEGGREGAQVVVEGVGGLGVEGGGIERRAVDLAVVEVERRAEIDVIAGAGGAAVDADDGCAGLILVHRGDDPAADQGVGQARLEVQLLALSDGQFVGDRRDEAIGVVGGRDALFGTRIAGVEPGIVSIRREWM